MISTFLVGILIFLELTAFYVAGTNDQSANEVKSLDAETDPGDETDRECVYSDSKRQFNWQRVLIGPDRGKVGGF